VKIVRCLRTVQTSVAVGEKNRSKIPSANRGKIQLHALREVGELEQLRHLPKSPFRCHSLLCHCQIKCLLAMIQGLTPRRSIGPNYPLLHKITGIAKNKHSLPLQVPRIFFNQIANTGVQIDRPVSFWAFPWTGKRRNQSIRADDCLVLKAMAFFKPCVPIFLIFAGSTHRSAGPIYEPPYVATWFAFISDGITVPLKGLGVQPVSIPSTQRRKSSLQVAANTVENAALPGLTVSCNIQLVLVAVRIRQPQQSQRKRGFGRAPSHIISLQLGVVLPDIFSYLQRFL
jgi:hypothetical protein